jgi:hypothetical protein
MSLQAPAALQAVQLSSGFSVVRLPACNLSEPVDSKIQLLRTEHGLTILFPSVLFAGSVLFHDDSSLVLG